MNYDPLGVGSVPPLPSPPLGGCLADSSAGTVLTTRGQIAMTVLRTMLASDFVFRAVVAETPADRVHAVFADHAVRHADALIARLAQP